MTPVKTEIIWTYTPDSYLETSFSVTTGDADIGFDGGRVTATLRVPQDPVLDATMESLGRIVSAVLVARQLDTRRPFGLKEPHVIQHQPGGKQSTAMSVDAGAYIVALNQIDTITADANGNIIHDSRAERLAEQEKSYNMFVQATSSSPVVAQMLESYRKAMDDPVNELIYLYEIRDAAVKHYGNKKTARKALGISEADWSRLGRLACTEPLLEGRHRGSHGALRKATHEELNEARGIARAILEALALLVNQQTGT